MWYLGKKIPDDETDDSLDAEEVGAGAAVAVDEFADGQDVADAGEADTSLQSEVVGENDAIVDVDTLDDEAVVAGTSDEMAMTDDEEHEVLSTVEAVVEDSQNESALSDSETDPEDSKKADG